MHYSNDLNRAIVLAMAKAHPEMKAADIAKKVSGVTLRQVQYWLSREDKRIRKESGDSGQ